MMGEKRGILFPLRLLLFFEDTRDRGVCHAAAFRELRSVCDFLREGMLERVHDFRKERLLVDEVALPQRAQPLRERLVVDSGDAPQERLREALADDGGFLEHAASALGKAIDACREQ